MAKTVALVSCVSKKHNRPTANAPTQIRDAYPLFKLSRGALRGEPVPAGHPEHEYDPA